MNTIDLRSDTVTRPTPGMRRAMAEAEVGDAVIDVDPTTDQLERMVAEMLGKEAGLFMPSGSMTNQIAIRIHCDRGSEFLCEADCHVYNYEQAAFAQLSGISAHPIVGKAGVLTVDQLQPHIRPENDHMVRTRLLSLENTHNRWAGKVQPQDEIVAVCDWARNHSLVTHLDGARLWNAAVATGRSLAELARPFDSVSVCMSKGLGAPVGSVLVGPRDFIGEAKRARKLFGGGMRQSGVLAAAAIYALEHHLDRLRVDHDHAQRLARVADHTETLCLRGARADTNIVIFEISPDWGTAAKFHQLLSERGIACFTVSPQAIRLVTHLDVDSDAIDVAANALLEIANSQLAAVAS